MELNYETAGTVFYQFIGTRLTVDVDKTPYLYFKGTFSKTDFFTMYLNDQEICGVGNGVSGDKTLHEGQVLDLNEPLIRYRLHGNNAVGFGKKERRIELPNHKASREPFMARFFKQMDTVTPVPHKRYYLFLYYCRIPYIKAILKRAFCGG